MEGEPQARSTGEGVGAEIVETLGRLAGQGGGTASGVDGQIEWTASIGPGSDKRPAEE